MVWQGRGRAKLRNAICTFAQSLRPWGQDSGVHCLRPPHADSLHRAPDLGHLTSSSCLGGAPLDSQEPRIPSSPITKLSRAIGGGSAGSSPDEVPHVISFPSLNITDVRQTSSSQNNLWLLDHLAGIYVESLMEFLIYFVFIFFLLHITQKCTFLI